MSSSLISVGSVGASVATPGQSAAGESAPKTLMDVFAGLLAKASGDAETGVEITQSSSATINGVEVTEAAGDIIATLLQGQADAAPEGEGGAPTSLADLLLKLQAALDAGEALDPELLKKLSESIDALAAMIGGIEVSADGTVTADLSADAAAKVAAPAARYPAAG